MGACNISELHKGYNGKDTYKKAAELAVAEYYEDASYDEDEETGDINYSGMINAVDGYQVKTIEEFKDLLPPNPEDLKKFCNRIKKKYEEEMLNRIRGKELYIIPLGILEYHIRKAKEVKYYKGQKQFCEYWVYNPITDKIIAAEKSVVVAKEKAKNFIESGRLYKCEVLAKKDSNGNTCTISTFEPQIKSTRRKPKQGNYLTYHLYWFVGWARC
jgi:hypothetical protein